MKSFISKHNKDYRDQLPMFMKVQFKTQIEMFGVQKLGE